EPGAPSPTRRPRTATRSDRASDAPPDTVRIRIQTVPAHATLTMDGTRIANPFDANLSRSGAHRIGASADGFAPASREVTFDRPHQLTLRLRAERTAPASAPTTAAPRSLPIRPQAPAEPPPPRSGSGFV